ncbi:MAG: aquaporin [Thermoplasmata archaeon]|nr:aquaporin [Thermoplasmata archaeon]MCI4359800.1 aquaporin [Thermoplasmata archaeon]
MNAPLGPDQTTSLKGMGSTGWFEVNRRGFDDPRLEWRRLFAEGFGTFFLVTVAAGAGVVSAVEPGSVGRVASVVAPGLMVMAIILFMGAVSGAHLNPAVSIAFAARGDFPWRRVPGYIVAQLIGASAAGGFLALLFGHVGMLGATEPSVGISDVQAVVLEIVLTLGLVSTILGTASKAQNVGPIAALAVGGYVALAGLWGSPISGASMNPARSFGPDLVLLNFSHYWVYAVGPVTGALLAVGVAFILRGPGGDEPAIQAAQGRLEEFLPLPGRPPDGIGPSGRIRGGSPGPNTDTPPTPDPRRPGDPALPPFG